MSKEFVVLGTVPPNSTVYNQSGTKHFRVLAHKKASNPETPDQTVVMFIDLEATIPVSVRSESLVAVDEAAPADSLPAASDLIVRAHQGDARAAAALMSGTFGSVKIERKTRKPRTPGEKPVVSKVEIPEDYDLNVHTLAYHLGVKPVCIAQRVKACGIPGEKFGKSWYFRSADFPDGFELRRLTEANKAKDSDGKLIGAKTLEETRTWWTTEGKAAVEAALAAKAAALAAAKAAGKAAPADEDDEE